MQSTEERPAGLSGIWIAGPLLLGALALLSYWATPQGPSITLMNTDGVALDMATPGEALSVGLPDNYSHALVAVEAPPGPLKVVWPVGSDTTGDVQSARPTFEAPDADFVMRIYLSKSALTLAQLEDDSQTERLRIAVPVRATPK